MRNVSTIKKENLRNDQFFVFVKVLALIKNEKEAVVFINSFFTESEKAYFGQRLNIVRMIMKDFSYSQIIEILKTQSATIGNSKKCVDKGGNMFKKIVQRYKYKSSGKDAPKQKANYPGAIKI